MKKWITMILALTCALSMVSCSAIKNIFNKNGDDSRESDEYMGVITEKEAEEAEGVFWKYADQGVLKELDAAFEEKKAIAQGFWEVPKTTGTTYYVSSAKGNDSAAGTSTSTAWKSCANLTSSKLKAGDKVLFECGSEFREKVSLVDGVTYASYGNGDKPVFSGGIDASDKSLWKAVSGKSGLYQYAKTLPSAYDIGTIVFDGGKAWGIKVQQLRDAEKSLELVDVSNGLEHFDKIPSYKLKTGKDLGKYNLSFYHDGSTLYLYCKDGNPADVFDSIELCKDVRLFTGSNVKNVTIANINFKNATFGIRTTVCKDLEVRNCGFEFIGGQVQEGYGDWRNYDTRLGNAIENWNDCDGMLVENCYFNQIYDTAMTTQSNTDGTDMINIVYRNNVVENVVYAIELWSSGAKEASCDFKNVIIEGNVCRNLGYGFTSQRPDKVTGFLSAKGTYYVYKNASITDNIVNGSIDWLYRTNNIATNENPNGYVMDGNVYVNTVGNDIGLLSASFPKYSDSIIEFEYNYDTVKKLYGAGVETHGKFYYTFEKSGEDNDQDQQELLNSYLLSAPSYTYTMEGGATLPFRLLFPAGYEEGKSYRLFTYLNYEYANGTDNLKNVQMANELISQVFADGNYIVLVPQCPTDGTWTGLGVENGNYSIESVAESDVMKSVYGLIHDVALKYKTVGNYAAGVSAGAYAVADLCARHEGLIKAAVLLAGAGDPSASVGSTKTLIYHGEGDEKIPVSNARELAEAWGADYREQSRELHDCWKLIFMKDDALVWLNEN